VLLFAGASNRLVQHRSAESSCWVVVMALSLACSLPNAQQVPCCVSALEAPAMVNILATHDFRHNSVLSRALPEKKPK
jgi:hypothetical protein